MPGSNKLYKLSSCVRRQFTTQTIAHHKSDTIKMAYASYESTNSSDAKYPLIIMHGLFGSKGNWNSLSKAYQQKTLRKIIAVDARNHGDSPHSPHHSYVHMSEDIKAFLDDFRITKASLLGHSMGGRAMMAFALRNPTMVEKLIVADVSPINSSPSLSTMPQLFELLLKCQMPKVGPISAARSSLDKQLAKKIPDRGLRAFLLTNLVQKGDGSYAWRLNLPSLIANFNHISQFPDLESTFSEDTLFIAGSASDYILKSEHEAIKNIFPKAKFEYIEGAGHWLHSENPNEFLRITVEFLNE